MLLISYFIDYLIDCLFSLIFFSEIYELMYILNIAIDEEIVNKVFSVDVSHFSTLYKNGVRFNIADIYSGKIKIKFLTNFSDPTYQKKRLEMYLKILEKIDYDAKKNAELVVVALVLCIALSMIKINNRYVF